VWTYTVPNASVQYLQAGETKVETFTVTSIDGTTQNVVVTITGIDEPAPAVNSVVVNEASPFAVFQVTGQAGLVLTLGLADVSANGGGADYGAAGASNLSVSTDGGATWSPYTSTATIPAGGTLLVRTPLNNDGHPDNNETFTLTATNADGLPASGTATIRDDGTGTVFQDDGTDDPGAVRDDDRPLTVSSPVVNEASAHVYFSVGGAANQTVTLNLAPGTAEGDGTDYGTTDSANITVSTDGGVTWVPYTGGPIVLSPSGQLLVRTPLVDDGVPDDGETLTLTATNTGGTGSSGTATIRDDGTGTVFLPNGGPDPAGVPTDDRPLAVNSVTVSESSPYVVFQVTGQPGQWVALALDSGTATVGADTGTALQYFDGNTWRDVAPGVAVQIPAGSTTLLVRTAIVNDQVLEGPETFRLVARNTGGAAASGTATVTDDGTSGNRFEADNTSGTPSTGIADDDRAAPAVSPVVPVAPAAPAAAPAATLAVPAELPAPAESAPAPAVPLPAALILVPERIVVGEILTSNSGFRASVVEGPLPALTVFKGITDQFVENSGTAIAFVLPADAFAHTRSDAVVTLTAKMMDGSPLPVWIAFDGQSGTFRLTPPPGASDELEIQVIARDSEGREVTAKFRLFVKVRAIQQGRESFSTQIRWAAHNAGPLVDLVRGPALPDERPAAKLQPRPRA
jgi:hypothetical protein